MSEQSIFILTLIETYLIVIFFKALRDIINYRFKFSVFTYLPGIVKNYLLDKTYGVQNSIDGWHQSDGATQMFPLFFIFIWGNYWYFDLSLWLLIIIYLAAMVIYYLLFNFFFHWLFMKKDKRDL